MKKLILLRHAKSRWDDPALDDHDRPLNRRGKEAAPVIARWLAERGHLPELVLCSSSVRTQQTVERMRRGMPELSDPQIVPELYHAAPGTMLEHLHAVPHHITTAMLVGHQPGLGSLTRLLSDGNTPRRCARAFEHFPTAAAAVLDVDVENWADLDYASARFIDFAKPRELMEA